MTIKQGHFEVDRKGLAKLIEKRGKSFTVLELVQNAWDTAAARVDIRLDKLPGKPFARLVVTDDDPNGFVDLTHAYTLFAESFKKDRPELRGRFNLGEKLVIALCRWATVSSTTGTVFFYEDGRREETKEKLARGSVFDAEIRMNQEEYDEVAERIDYLIPPVNVVTSFNGRELRRPKLVASFEAVLPTVTADEDGNLVRTRRKTTVNVYEPKSGHTPHIYELGIPVVETEGKYHIDVQQKVPLNADRDNVPPAFLRKLRAEVLNATHEHLTQDDASETWVTDALGHPDVQGDAVVAALDKRFGEKRAIWDPSDLEANNNLTGQGYHVIAGGTFGKDVWANIKASGAMQRAGELAPTLKLVPGGRSLPVEEWSGGMHEVAALARWLAVELLGIQDLHVLISLERGYGGAYGYGRLTFSLPVLGHAWFNGWRDGLADVLRLIVHEFAHEYESNHLSENYHKACTRLAGKLAVLALQKPEGFQL